MELNRLRELAGILQVNEAKSSKTPMEILNDLAKTIFGEFGFATLKVPQMATLVNIEKADKIAKDNRETGIATCSEDLMKEIFNKNPSLLIGKAAKKLGAK